MPLSVLDAVGRLPGSCALVVNDNVPVKVQMPREGFHSCQGIRISARGTCGHHGFQCPA